MKMEQTQCSKTSAYKFRRREITQKKAHRILLYDKSTQTFTAQNARQFCGTATSRNGVTDTVNNSKYKQINRGAGNNLLLGTGVPQDLQF
jgi:hypothetical protein